MGISKKERRKLKNIKKEISKESQSFKNRPTAWKGLWEVIIENKKIILLITAVIFLLYFKTLNYDFVSDDIATIRDNTGLGNINRVFDLPFFFLAPFFHFLINNVFGNSPIFFRLWNVLLHAGSSIFLYLILQKIYNRKIGFLAALTFAIHPIMVESVTWISGYSSSQYAFFFLVSFYIYLYSKGFDRFYYASLFVLLLSLLSGHRAIVVPFIFVAYNFLIQKFSLKRNLAFLFLGFFWVYLAFSGLGNRISVLNTQHYSDVTFINPLIQLPIAFGEYLYLLILPINLTLYHTEIYITPLRNILSYSVFALFIFGLIYGFLKKRHLVFWLMFFLISLSPTLTPFGVTWLVAERYVYISTIGLFVLFSIFIDYLYKRYPKINTILNVVIFVLLSFFFIRTFTRNGDWKNQDTLWEATVKVSPNSHNAHNNMGDVYSRRGDYKNALNEFMTAVKIKPDYADGYHNIAFTYEKLGDSEKAKEFYLKALDINPNLWQSSYKLAVLYYNDKNFEECLKYLEYSYKLTGNIQILQGIGDVYRDMGDIEKAISTYKEVLKIIPTNEYVQAELAKLQLKQ